MKRILHLISSPRGDESFSIKLANAIIAKLQDQYPNSSVEVANLIESNVPHLDTAHLRSFFTPQEQLTAEDQDAIRYSDGAISQLMAADIIVIGAPLYNFGIHSSLKAWIDHIARAGKTFSYNEQGVQGLVNGKKVYIAMSSGAVYSEGPYQPYDFVSTYLKAMLGFIGMTDITLFRVEGVNIPGIKEEAMDKAILSVENSSEF
ncbi:FMN-dependent NADH-azoreductase [Pedobacter metabolipauper]|uniref:FMN dependent NADH:quinone oxidoreductase n=1 Tax=Pedobacter metabolipauper TaxID=425513 RepID=A0A4R6SVD8_9SPHI|nr:NAD(P)H-dependent oxidoreductase [Pedobacter metabolipauper]TDQ08062.1 FMN-dependent NADH-azoreductase [Pedobacter metabolipauper]